MRKYLWLGMATLLLMVLAGCTPEADSQQQELIVEAAEEGDLDEEEPIIEIESEAEEEEEIEEEIVTEEVKVVRDMQANFTSTWAKTDTHFFFTDSEFTGGHHLLYRLPLDNIAQGETVVVPGDGHVEILGMNEQYLFVSRRTGVWEARNYDTYRISLSTLDAVLIDSGIYYGVPRFHPASNSILFAHDNLDEMTVILEYLQLDTGVRNDLYEFESINFASSNTGWWQMEDGAVVFINSDWAGADLAADFVLIDAELRAQRILSTQIGGIFTQLPEPLEPQNPAEEYISELDALFSGRFVMIDDWVYYLRLRDDWYNNLYRINTDGTQNTLLQNDIEFSRLFSINNTLLAIIFPRPHQAEASAWYEAVKLAEDGSIEKVLGGGWDGNNASFGMRQLLDTDIVKIVQFNFFRVDGWVVGLYCTDTGALFSID